MKTSLSYWLVALPALLAGCTPVSTESSAEELLAADRAFAQYSVEAGAAEAFKAYLLENALQLPAGRAPIRGRNAIYESMVQAGGGYTLFWEPQEAEVAESGEMGYTWGTYTFTVATDSGETQSRGKYLNVWKKDEDGEWKVLIDTGNASPND